MPMPVSATEMAITSLARFSASFCGFQPVLAGSIVNVTITATEPWFLEGELAEAGMFIAKPQLVLA